MMDLMENPIQDNIQKLFQHPPQQFLNLIVSNYLPKDDLNYFLELGFPLNPILKEYEFPNILSSQIGIGPIVFEFLKPTDRGSIYQDCFDNRGEGITDFIYLVDDLKVEIEKLTQNGVNLIDWNTDFAILDTRKEGNILTRLIQS